MKYKRFNELTVGEYQEIYSIATGKDDDLDKSIQFVSILTGLTWEQVSDLDIGDFNKVIREIDIIFSNHVIDTEIINTCKVDGKKYNIIHNPRKLKSGQYIDVQTFMKGNVILNMHKLFACLLRRRGWFGVGKYNGKDHEVISEGVRDMNFITVHATCVFFLSLWNNSIAAIRDYLKEELQRTGNQTAQEITEMDLQNIMAGSITQRRYQNLKG